jgi:uncharacterized DUF497 family protein
VRVMWDPRKAASNHKKHNVRFSGAEAVLFDHDALSREDTTAQGEQRFVSVGADASGRILIVVYAYRGETVRLISARAVDIRQ